ncbi:MAG: Hsp20/alpha crystallin family protein [Myxococcota bacterium]
MFPQVVFRDRWTRSFLPETRALRPVFLEETEEGLTLRAELPGLSADELNITVHGRHLTLEGERTVAPPEGFRTLHRERESYRVAHRLTLPFAVDGEAVTATLEQGLLEMTLPRAASEKPRTITVNA